MPFIPGTTIGSYEVTAKIGEGGIVSVAANVRLARTGRSRNLATELR